MKCYKDVPTPIMKCTLKSGSTFGGNFQQFYKDRSYNYLRQRKISIKNCTQPIISEEIRK